MDIERKIKLLREQIENSERVLNLPEMIYLNGKSSHEMHSEIYEKAFLELHDLTHDRIVINQ